MSSSTNRTSIQKQEDPSVSAVQRGRSSCPSAFATRERPNKYRKQVKKNFRPHTTLKTALSSKKMAFQSDTWARMVSITSAVPSVRAQLLTAVSTRSAPGARILPACAGIVCDVGKVEWTSFVDRQTLSST